MAEPFGTLRLEVLTQKPVIAREGGLLIERIANAFDQMNRAGRLGDSDARLHLEHLGIGSLYVDFGVVSVLAYMAFDQRAALAQFVGYLADSVALIKSFRVEQVPPANRSAIEAMAAPVARGHATQINLFVFGENQDRIEIGPELAATVMSALARPRSGTQDLASEVAAQAVSLPHLQERSAGRQIDYARPVASYDARDGTNGTMIWITDRWFVRPEGMNGAMLPVEGTSTSGFDQAQTYIVQGRILKTGELPTSFVPTLMHGPLR